MPLWVETPKVLSDPVIEPYSPTQISFPLGTLAEEPDEPPSFFTQPRFKKTPRIPKLKNNLKEILCDEIIISFLPKKQ